MGGPTPTNPRAHPTESVTTSWADLPLPTQEPTQQSPSPHHGRTYPYQPKSPPNRVRHHIMGGPTPTNPRAHPPESVTTSWADLPLPTQEPTHQSPSPHHGRTYPYQPKSPP